MSFLQSGVLLALPLVLIPIVIHLVNQWRFQSKNWAAMQFLLSAKAMHRGLARFRQWLILAMRMLAILGLLFAIARPLSSGLLGLIANGQNDTTIVLLDRSPSMQSIIPGTNQTKLELVRQRLLKAFQSTGSKRWILIDSENLKPIDFPSADSMLNSSDASPSVFPTNWPRMMTTAIEAIRSQSPGQAHLWICSDLRSHDWDVENSQWKLFQKELKELPTDLRIFSLNVPEPPTANRSLRISEAKLGSQEQQLMLSVNIEVSEFTSNDNAKRSMPQPTGIEWMIDGVRSRSEIAIDGESTLLRDFKIPISDGKTTITGSATLPLDENLADNVFHFAAELPKKTSAIIVAEDPSTMRSVAIGAKVVGELESADAGQTESYEPVIVIDRADFDVSLLSNCSLLVWQGESPDANQASTINDYLSDGGCIWFFPPTSQTLVNSQSTNDTLLPLSPTWQSIETSTVASSVTQWQSDTGLLAATKSGSSLPFDEVKVLRYRQVQCDASTLASIGITIEGMNTNGADSSPLFMRLNSVKGNAFVWTTLPIETWSNLGSNGVALFVALQRSIELGRLRLSNVIPWEQSNVDQSQMIGLASPAQRATGGVVSNGRSQIVLNRIPPEDDPKTIEGSSLNAILGDISITQIEDMGKNDLSVQREIWKFFLIAMIAFLIFESFLSLPKSKSPWNQK